MEVTPVKLARAGGGAIQIQWSDGCRREYLARELRDACPCATCREKRTQPAQPSSLLPVLSLSEAQPLTIAGMQPVGNYAYSIEFSDGHSTGIYTLELLKQLGKESN
jgi:DUF971 family protein